MATQPKKYQIDYSSPIELDDSFSDTPSDGGIEIDDSFSAEAPEGAPELVARVDPLGGATGEGEIQVSQRQPTPSIWDRRLSEAQGVRPGLDPENEFGAARYTEEGTYIPTPLNIARGAVDLIARGGEYAGALGATALDYVDEAARYTGLAELPELLGINDLYNQRMQILPGSAVGAVGEAFPLGGVEAGLVNPSMVSRFTPEQEAAYLDVAQKGTAEDIVNFARQNGFDVDPVEAKAFIVKRDRTGGVTPDVRYGDQMNLPLEEQQSLPFDGPTPEQRALETRLQEEADTFLSNRPELPDYRQRELPLEYPPQQTSFDFGPSSPKQKAVTPRDIPESDVSPVVADAVNHINALTEDWANSPSIEVFDNFDDLDGVDPDAIGVTRPDNSVAINMKSVNAEAEALGVHPNDVLTAATYHESLGHYGLAERFGQGLNDFLMNLYNNSESFRNRVNNRMAENPDDYADDHNPVAAHAEEVLAEMSQDGRISPTMMNRLRDFVKGIGREMGFQIKYSNREIKSILGTAHDTVVKGKKGERGGSFVNRYMSSLWDKDYRADDPDVIETAEMMGIPEDRIAKALTEADFRGQVFLTKREKQLQAEKNFTTAQQKRRASILEQREALKGKPGEIKFISPYPEEPSYWRFQLNTADGEPITGKYNISDDGKMIEDFSIGMGGKPNRLGPSRVRDIARAIRRQHPEVEKLEGLRISGARKGTGKDLEFVEHSLNRYMKRRKIEASDASKQERLRLRSYTLTAPPKETAGTFLNELGVYSPGELRSMSADEVVEAAERLGIDKDWVDYFNDRRLGIQTPQPDMSRYLPQVKYMKRRTIGKGSDGPRRGLMNDTERTEETPRTIIANYTSKRNVEDILREVTPESTPESWDQWIEESGKIKMTGKMAQDLATGTKPPELKAAERFLLESGNRVYDLSAKVASGRATERETYLLGAEIERAQNVAQSLQGVVTNAGRILNARKIEVASDRALSDGIRNMLMSIEKGDLKDPERIRELAVKLEKVGKEGKVWGKAMDIFANALSFPRTVMSSMDLSAPLRQGIVFVGEKEFWKSIPAMFKAMKSDTAFEAVMSEIKSRPTYQLMEDSGVAFTDIGGKLLDREERFLSKWAEYIPGVKMSERAYTGFLNKLRADVFDSLVKDYENAGIKLTPFGGKTAQIAKFVNNATGRGDLGSLNTVAPQLSAVFFSPRLIASRIRMLNPKTYIDLDPIARKRALKSVAKFGTIATTVLGLAKMAGADVETDPRSSDFAKIKVGNTRYDILGGFGQYLVLGARMATNEKKNAKGEVVELGKKFGSDTRLDVLLDFGINKESPVASFVTDYLRGKNAIGEPFDAKKKAIESFIPLFLQDASELIREEGAAGVPMSLPGLFGVGMQTYDVELGYDAYGRDVETLLKEDEPESDPVVLETQRLIKNEANDFDGLPSAPKSFRDSGEKYVLTPEETKEWQRVMGEYTRQYLAEDMASDEYMTADDLTKVEIVKEAHRDAYEDTKTYFLENVLNANPEEGIDLEIGGFEDVE